MPNEQTKITPAAHPQGVHLVGSVPLANAEEVFRTAGSTLGGRLRRIPDGETGLRTKWPMRISLRPQFIRVHWPLRCPTTRVLYPMVETIAQEQSLLLVR